MREVHASPQSVSCQQCEKKFSRNAKLQDHIKAVHTEIKEKGFQCTKCVKKFARKDVLKRHQNEVHKEQQLYICPECPEEFARLEYFNNHMKTGKHSVMIECEYCYRLLTFKSKSEAFNHTIKAPGYARNTTCKNIHHALGKMPTEEDREAQSERKFVRGMKKKAKETYDEKTDGDYGEYVEKLISKQRKVNEENENYWKTKKNNQYDADKSMLDPYSGEPIQDPMQNTICGHVYNRKTIEQLIKDREANGLKMWCPFAPDKKKKPFERCSNKSVSLSDLKPDIVMKAKIEKRKEIKRKQKAEEKRKDDKWHKDLWERKVKEREEKLQKKKIKIAEGKKRRIQEDRNDSV